MIKVWKRELLLVITLGLFIMLVVTVIAHLFGGSATGTVHTGETQHDITAPHEQPTAQLTSTFFSATLPAGFSLKRQSQNPTGSTMYSALALSSMSADQQLAVTAGHLPGGGLSAIGDYNLRASQTNMYQPYTLPGLPAAAVAYRTSSGTPSFIVFWPHGTMYFEIALSTDGGANMDQLSQTFAQLLATWQWK